MTDYPDSSIAIIPEAPHRSPVHVKHWCGQPGCKRCGFGYKSRYGGLCLVAGIAMKARLS